MKDVYVKSVFPQKISFYLDSETIQKEYVPVFIIEELTISNTKYRNDTGLMKKSEIKLEILLNNSSFDVSAELYRIHN